VMQAFGSFLRMIPATLRKRRSVQRGRRIEPAAFAAQVRTDYPLPSRLGRLL
jgi:hypothetical protein